LNHSASPLLWWFVFFLDRVLWTFLPRFGFKPWSSWSLSPELLELQVWATSAHLCWVFLTIGSQEWLALIGFNLGPPDLCLPSS
jgi:hypothetical protein